MNKNDVTKYQGVSHTQFLLYAKKFLALCLTTCLIACSSSPSPKTKQKHKFTPSFICQNPDSYAGRVVGDGECVSLIKLCSLAPNTTEWRAGEKVLSLAPGAIKVGSIIATFENGKYPSKTGYHAAIYISHDNNGIWVWDQWVGKPVHKRLIRVRVDKATASNTAQAYRIVR